MKFLLGLDILKSVVNFFQTIKETLSLDYLLYIFVGLEILTIIVFAIVIRCSYEIKLTKAIDKINGYLYDKQYINESNLIEFNKLMKRVPKTLRYHWQQYMLNREKAPSEYMSVENCVDRPLKSSSVDANIKITKYLSVIYSVLAFILGCGWASNLEVFSTSVLLYIFAIPVIVLVLNYFFIIIVRLRKTANTSDLYQTFHIFNRFIDKAVSTMPNYVDFEVLFTAKEIKRGIPVLNEYIEKRQLQEQEEMRKARENAVQHELYNFEEAGEKGELVLERAMKETDIFVNMRNRLNTEIDQFEKEIDSLKRSFDNTTKDYLKKLQASKENSERLREQQEATTNRIENNYIRKQQADEIKKQQAIEKDQEDAQLRFNQEINNLTAEIEKRKEELANAKLNVEKSMLAEYKTFSNKIYAEIRNSVNKQVKEERDELIGSREQVARELEEAVSKIDALEVQNKTLVNKADQREAYIRAKVEQEKTDLQKQLVRMQEILKEKDKQIQLISSDYSVLENQSKQKPKKVAKAKNEEVKEFNVGPIHEDERFDENGNFFVDDKTYFDKEGKMHDENGRVFEKDGRLVEEANQPEIEKNDVEKTEDEIYEALKENLNFDVFNETKQEEDASEQQLPPQQVEEEQEQVEQVAEEETDKQPQEEVAEQVAEANEESSDGEQQLEQAEEAKPVVRRGRPRKQQTEQVEEKQPKKRGRPRKVENQQAEETQQKKRGRPKKVESQQVENKQPKKRGRPKKEQQVENKQPKKRGRPKKVNIDENLKLIEERLKEQNELLKKQQIALDKTVQNATNSTDKPE